MTAPLDALAARLRADPDGVRAALDAVLADAPDRLDARFLRAAARSLGQDYAGAADDLEICAAREARALTEFNLGYVRRQLGDYAGGLKRFLRACALPDATPEARALAANTALILGERPLAEALPLEGPIGAFQRALAAATRAGDLRFAPGALPLDDARAVDQAVLFWMKYDCHCYGALDDKARLADRLGAARPWFWPETVALSEAAARPETAARTGWALFKPAAGSGGRGIRLVGPGDPVPEGRGALQAFIDPPFLYEGRKVNLRLMLAIPRPRPVAAHLWREGLVFVAAEPWAPPTAGPAPDGAVANLLRAERGVLAQPLGRLPGHAAPLSTFLAEALTPAEARALVDALRRLAGDLTARLAEDGFFETQAAIGADGLGFPPRFVGLDVGLDAGRRPWLFEIERYPGLGGVSPATAPIHARFRRDWLRFTLANAPADDPAFERVA